MNRWERKLYRFRARIYMRLPKSSKLVKLQVALLLLGMLLLGERVFDIGKNVLAWLPDKETHVGTKENREDEPDYADAIFVLEYANGSDALLLKEPDSVKLPQVTVSITVPEETITPTPTVIVEREENPDVAVMGGAYQSVFTPNCYPVLSDILGTAHLLENLQQLDYLKETFYIVNSTTEMVAKDFDADALLNTDLSMEKNDEPQILIYHTHASEGFIDSRAGVSADTVVGIGEELARILREKYGYNVIHDATVFDMKNGKDNRSNAYNEALTYIEELLEANPSIEVVIDLHRDAGAKRVVTLQGKQVAKVMLFNGLSRTKSGALAYLPNENLKENLAFSFQMKLIGDEMYPGLMNRIYLKDYRYNMHLKERYLLVELGTQNNTVEEARNAMEPLADVLAQVLGK